MLASKDKTIYIRGDKSIQYGVVMNLVSQLKEGGVSEVSLVTEPVTGKPEK